MARAHLIETACFDIAFGCDEHAFEQQAELGSFIRRELITVVDELFSESAGGDGVIRIDTLEVDLGDVSYSEYRDELPKRLREELRTLLANLKHNGQSEVATGSQQISSPSNERQQVEYFLLHGYLPWYSTLQGEALEAALKQLLATDAGWLESFIAQSPSPALLMARVKWQFSAEISQLLLQQLASLPGVMASTLITELKELLDAGRPQAGSDDDQLLRQRVVDVFSGGAGELLFPLWGRLVSEEASLFESLLRHHGQQPAVRRHIAADFPDAYIRDIVRILEPVEHGVITAVVDDTELLQSEAATDSRSESDARSDLWEFSLAYLLVERGSRFNKTSYLESLIRQMAARDNLGYRQLLTEILDHVTATAPSGASRIVSEMHGVLSELHARLVGEHHFSGEASQAAGGAMPPEVQLDEMVSQALITGSIAALIPLWTTLLKEASPLFVRLLQRHGQLAAVRKRIACDFPDPYLCDIVKIVEPVEHGFITAVVDQADHLRHTSAAVSKRQLWQFSLGYLLVERGSRFNRKSYLGSLIRQMAAHDNMGYSQLLGEINQRVATLTGSSLVAQQMQQLLAELGTELDTELGQAPTSAEAHPEAMDEALLESCGHLDILRQLFANGGAGWIDETSIMAAIDNLARRHPWMLLQLQRQLQSGATAWQSALERFSAPLLQKLVTAFLGLMQTADMGGRSDLLDAINTNASRAINVRSYYRQLLATLLVGEMIDFDAIMQRSNVATDEPVMSVAKSDTRTTVTEKGGKQVIDESDTARLRHYLLTDGELSPQSQAALIRNFELLAQRASQPLSLLLASMIPNSAAVARLIQLLPERLLARCLPLLRMSESGRLLQSAGLVTSACYLNELVTEAALLPRLKWQFIFYYLGESGGLFNERDFSQRYVAYLAAQTRQPDPQKFRAQLSQQLVINILPSTRDLTLRIIESVTKDEAPSRQSVAVIERAELSAASTPRHEESDQPPLENIYITNAGLVLAAPYLPRLFQMLQLTDNGAFINRAAAVRGAHMLQFLVNGQSASPEYLLMLNKLLCGIKSGAPIELGIEITADEKKIIEGLLQGMIQNWKVLGNTSIAGLRESFLQREGRLQLKDDAWHLLVEPRSFDMLLDQIPWGYSTIKYPWMERVIYVDWR